MGTQQVRTGVMRSVVNKGGDRHYGFINLDDGRVVFFLFLGGRVFDVTGSEPLQTDVKITRTPHVGDKVVCFVDESSERGPMAIPWGYANGSGAEAEQPATAE